MTATPKPEPARVRARIREFLREFAPGASDADLAPAVAFLGAWASLPPQHQFLLQQRLVFGKMLEDIAIDYKGMFGRNLTAAGAAAAFKSAIRVLQSPG